MSPKSNMRKSMAPRIYMYVYNANDDYKAVVIQV